MRWMGAITAVFVLVHLSVWAVSVDPDPQPSDTTTATATATIPKKRCWRWAELKSCDRNYECAEVPKCDDSTDKCDGKGSCVVWPVEGYRCEASPDQEYLVRVHKCVTTGRETGDGCREGETRCLYNRIAPGLEGNEPAATVTVGIYAAGSVRCPNENQPSVGCVVPD